MGRWSKIEKDPYKRDRIAKETAINALRRRPLEIVELTLKTIPAEPCRERAGQRGNNDDEVIRPSSKKVSLYKRERLRWERFHRALAFLLFVHASILMLVVTALSPQPSVRYLQPVSILTLLTIAICVDWLARRARPAAMQSAS
ncbi:MAG: hypothetical protein DME59_15575 [Verrucomicrobia bacterium]|nr:MAG: hypothetical protein DME59_15575 [Verrucomicrobiota bacterium]